MSASLKKLEEISDLEVFLDPCCARELDDRRKALSMRQKLEAVDRSTEKIKLLASIYSDVCCLCHDPKCGSDEYPLLAELRGRISQPANQECAVADWCEQIHINSSKNASENEAELDQSDDSDAELDALLGDGFTSSFEIERLEEMNRFLSLQQQAQAHGFGKHRLFPHEDITIAFLKKCPRVVCHVVDESSRLCARIDLHLEQIAPLFLGTAFLRVRRFANDSLLAFLRVRGSSLVVVSAGVPTACCQNLTQFGDDENLARDSLDSWLRNTGILVSQPQPHEWAEISFRDGEAEECDGIEYFDCGRSGCRRTYQHDHISHGLPSAYISSADLGDGKG